MFPKNDQHESFKQNPLAEQVFQNFVEIKFWETENA